MAGVGFGEFPWTDWMSCWGRRKQLGFFHTLEPDCGRFYGHYCAASLHAIRPGRFRLEFAQVPGCEQKTFSRHHLNSLRIRGFVGSFHF